MRLQPIKNSLRERKTNRRRNQRRKDEKNRIKHLPKDKHGRMYETYNQPEVEPCVYALSEAPQVSVKDVWPVSRRNVTKPKSKATAFQEIPGKPEVAFRKSSKSTRYILVDADEVFLNIVNPSPKVTIAECPETKDDRLIRNYSYVERREAGLAAQRRNRCNQVM